MTDTDPLEQDDGPQVLGEAMSTMNDVVTCTRVTRIVLALKRWYHP